MKRTLTATTAALALLGATAAHATTATATTDLNIRSGPGAWHEVVGVIDAEGEAEVLGCYEEANWCEVTYNGTTGWAYGEYLAASLNDQPIAIVAPEARQQLEVATVTVETTDTEATSAAVGAGWGAIAGTLIAGPAGGAVGAILTTPVAVSADPGEQTVAYVQSNPVEPVYLDGELMVGAGIPQDIQVYTIPDSEFAYLNVNGVPVLVETEGRQIVQIVQ